MTGDLRTRLTPRFSLRVKGMLVLVFPVIALVAAVNSVLWLEQATRRADEMLRRAVDLRAQVRAVSTRLLEAETGVLGYLSSGDPGFLDPYRRAVADLPAEVDRLGQLASNAGHFSPPMGEIRRIAAAEIQYLQGLVESSAEPRAARPPVSRNRQDRERLQVLLEGMLLDADRVFRAADESRGMHYRRFAFVALVCGIVGPFGGLLINLLITNRLVRRVGQVGANAHRLARGQPLEPIPPGSDEIAALARELDEAAVLLRARENLLSSSETRYRDLFDQAPVAYHEAGRDGIIHHVNQAGCRLMGCGADDILGRPVWAFLAPEHQEETRIRLLEAIETGRDPAPLEVDHDLPDGSRLTAGMHANLIRGENGEVSGIRVALLDVTEHKVAVMAARKVGQYAHELRNKNEQLARAAAGARAATEAKSRFLANMSHELRTPLNSIIGFSELMYDGKAGAVGDAHRDYLADILTSARHLLRLINDILDLSKIESGKFEFRPERCDPARLAEEVCEVLQPLIAKKSLRLELELERGLSAFLDPARAKQVLYNYGSNAVKFTGKGGRITIRVRAAAAGRLRLEVEDTGAGIAPEDLPRLFAEFEQTAASRREGQGTGLGLALTKRLVEAQGGAVGVTSELGRGSLFFAELPLSGDVRSAPAPVRSHRPRSILVVEDNPQESRWLCQILREAGYAVETARNRGEAVEHAAARCFDAVTLDLMLPDASGWEVLREIRATGPNHSTPVIVVSVAPDREIGRMDPAHGYLAKPVQASDLLGALERAGAPPHRNRTVLVVDDDAATLRLVNATLAGLGYRAVCCGDGESGLVLLAQERPAVVLLDLMMPVLGGLEFLERMRADASLPHPPVIVWTNKDLTAGERERLLGLAETVMAKQDGTPQALLDRLRAIVG